MYIVKEKLEPKEESSFVITQGESVRRLTVGEKLNLEPGPNPQEGYEITSMELNVKEKALYIRVYFSDESVHCFIWGWAEKKIGSKEQSFGVSLADTALMTSENKHTLIGSDSFFDENFNTLTGISWALRYEPA